MTQTGPTGPATLVSYWSLFYWGKMELCED